MRVQLANWIVVGHAPSFNSVDLTLYGVISAEAPVRRFKMRISRSRRRGLSESESLDESGSGSGPLPAATCGFARGEATGVGIEISSRPGVRVP